MQKVDINIFNKYVDEFLKKFPQLKLVHRADDSLHIPKVSNDGFDVGIALNELTLLWGNWHSPMIDNYSIEDVFNYLHFMLTDKCRIREFYRWPFPYRGYLEFYENDTWIQREINGLLLYNFLFPKSIRIYQNKVLP